MQDVDDPFSWTNCSSCNLSNSKKYKFNNIVWKHQDQVRLLINDYNYASWGSKYLTCKNNWEFMYCNLLFNFFQNKPKGF
jgi:hypothetical protein